MIVKINEEYMKDILPIEKLKPFIIHDLSNVAGKYCQSPIIFHTAAEAGKVIRVGKDIEVP